MFTVTKSRVALFRIVVGFVICVGITVSCVVIYKRLAHVRRMSQISQMRTRLSECRNILHAYISKHRQLCPSHAAVGKGKNLFSWRLVVLEEVSQYYPALRELIRRIDFDQEWDSPYNAEIAKMICSRWNYFTFPTDHGVKVQIYALVGPNSFWDHSFTRPQDDWSESQDKLLLAMIPESKRFLLEPGDLTEDDLDAYAEQGLDVVVVTVSGRLIEWKRATNESEMPRRKQQH